MNAESHSVVVLTTGKQDRGARATLAFSWACTSLALGWNTTVFLTIDGAVWALEEATRGIQIDGFEPLHSYIEQFISLGGELIVCGPCTRYYCGVERPSEGKRLLPAAKIAGLSTIVARATPGSRVVSF